MSFFARDDKTYDLRLLNWVRMSKRKRKPSRRERRAGVDRPAKRPVDLSTAPAEPAESETAAPGPDDAQPTVTATFKPNAKSEATVTLEQRYIAHDLRRLGIQLGAFALLIIGLAVLDAQTDFMGSLGSSLFKLWE